MNRLRKKNNLNLKEKIIFNLILGVIILVIALLIKHLGK